MAMSLVITRLRGSGEEVFGPFSDMGVMVKVVQVFDCVFRSQGYKRNLISQSFMNLGFFREVLRLECVVRSVGLLTTFSWIYGSLETCL